MENFDGFQIIEDGAEVGMGTVCWEFSKITKNAVIGENCVIGQCCFIDGKIGNNVHIANNVSIYNGVEIEDECFIGNNVSFANVNIPKTFRPIDKSMYKKTKICYGVTIEPNATICPGITIGRHSVIGHGSVVVEDVPPYTMVNGNPAKVSLRSLNHKIKQYEKRKNIKGEESEDIVRDTML